MFEDVKITFKVSESQSFNVSSFQRFNVSFFQIFRISDFQIVRNECKTYSFEISKKNNKGVL